MKIHKMLSAVVLSLVLCGTTVAQTNEQDNKDAQHQLKKDEKADKTQAQADKAARKALASDKVKKASKKQDKANNAADKAVDPGK